MRNLPGPPALSTVASPIGRLADSVVNLVDSPLSWLGLPRPPVPLPSQLVYQVTSMVPAPPRLP